MRAARTWHQERKLLHWVNSLPPPACLLVETLADLRFGDVLLAIVRWLHAQQLTCEGGGHLLEVTDNNADDVRITSTEMSCDASVKRLRYVLRFVAREARSQDEDALFIVNEAHCAERVRGGDEGAICAVLRILKRMGDQLKVQAERQRQRSSGASESSRQQQEKEEDRLVVTAELLRLNALREESAKSSSDGGQVKRKRELRIVGLSSDRFRDASWVETCSQERVATRTAPPVKSSDSPRRSNTVASAAGVGLKKQLARKPKTTTSRHVPVVDQGPKIPMYRDNKGQLHIYSMVDPSHHKRAAHTTHNNGHTAAAKNQRERRVRMWMDSLGVGFQRKAPLSAVIQPEESPRTIFQDGVALCQIAASLVNKYGDETEKRNLETFVDQASSSDKVVLLPPEATLCPQSAAQKRKNVAIAVEILTKFCGMQRISKGKDDDGDNDIRGKLVAFFTAPDRRKSQPHSGLDDSVWELLDHVRVGIEASRSRVAADEASSQLKPTNKGLSDTAQLTNDETVSRGDVVDENSRLSANAASADSSVHQGEKRRRPYITSEQMQAVNRWLKSVNKDLLEVSTRAMEMLLPPLF